MLCIFMFVFTIVMADDELEAIDYLVEDSSEINEPNRVVQEFKLL